MCVSRPYALTAGISLLALIGASAQAQNTTRPDDPIKEVVVTGAAYGVSKDALMSNVDVLTREQIDQGPAKSLGDALAALPGVRSSSFSPGASRPVIRGLNGFRVLVLNNGMGQIDASAVSPDHAVPTDPTEAKRIEVLRGPSALSYGGNAIGGIVNIIDERIATVPAKDGLEGRATAQASSVDDGYQGAFNIKAGDGPWVFTLDAMKREAADYRTPVGPRVLSVTEAEGDVPDTRHTQVNSGVDLKDYGAGLSYIGDFGFVGASVKKTEELYGSAAEEDVTIALEQTRYDLRGQYNLEFAGFNALQWAAGYTDYEHTEYEGSETGTQFLSSGSEFRASLVRSGQGELSGVLGVNGLKRDFEAIGEEAFVPSTTTKELGVFSQYRLDKGLWGAEAGVRVDHKTIEAADYDQDFTNVSASFGTFYKSSDHSFYGASLTRSERAPSDVELLADGPHAGTGAYEIGDVSFNSEVGYSLELTGHWLIDQHSDFSIDAHVYGSKFDGFIDLRPTGAVEDDLPVYLYQQTDATFYGLELEAGFNLWARGDKAISLDLAYDYVHGDSDLGPVARIPPQAVNARLNYKDERLNTYLEVHYAGEQDRLAELETPTDSYTLVNLFAAYRLPGVTGVSVFAELHNIGDVEAREHVAATKDVVVQPGRNLRMGVLYKF